MNRKFIFIITTLLITPLISSCSLFGDDESFSCNDLVVTDETSPEPVDYRGDPSDQWVVSGIQTEYEDGETVNTLTVYAAYPNPANPTTQLSYNLPKDMTVKVRVKSSNGEYNQIIVDERKTSGRHQLAVELSESSSKCFRADFYFDGSEKSNAYGLIKIESAESR